MWLIIIDSTSIKMWFVFLEIALQVYNVFLQYNTAYINCELCMDICAQLNSTVISYSINSLGLLPKSGTPSVLPVFPGISWWWIYKPHYAENISWRMYERHWKALVVLYNLFHFPYNNIVTQMMIVTLHLSPYPHYIALYSFQFTRTRFMKDYKCCEAN